MVVTRSRRVSDLRRLGVRSGAITMVHTRMSAIGWVVGGSETVVRALLDVLGPGGRLTAIARHALGAGIGVRGLVGGAESHLFPAPELTALAMSWIEERVAGSSAPRAH
jgi:hypothetical protein